MPDSIDFTSSFQQPTSFPQSPTVTVPLESSIYDTQPYSWDGSSRPNIDDYIAPWADKANETTYSLAWSKKRKEHNAEVNYARTMLEAATAKYNSDLAFWQEKDSRAYNSQSSQLQRYEDAGFNVGYLYGQIESGNTSSGYSSPDASLSRPDTSDNGDKTLKAVASVVGTALSVVTSLARTGIDIIKAPFEIASLKNNNEAIELSNQWQKVLRSMDKDGNSVRDVAKSLAFSLQALSQKQGEQSLSIGEKELKRLESFIKYCDKIYENQSIDPNKEIINGIKTMINGIDFSFLGQYEALGKRITQMLALAGVIKSL